MEVTSTFTGCVEGTSTERKIGNAGKREQRVTRHSDQEYRSRDM